MHDEFDFHEITSVEFCVSVRDGEDYTNYLVPSQHNVQNALKEMLGNTTRQLEASDDDWQAFELSEKYAARETLIADLASEEMATISALYDEEGWTSNPAALTASAATPANIPYYFAVFRDSLERKLLGVRQAAQFKGVLTKRLIRLLDDSLTMIEDRVFKLDNDFDFLITSQHVYILHPGGFERIAQMEKFVSAKAREKTASTRELADAIIAFPAARNENPRRYVWKAKGEDILRKINAARQALAAVQPDSNAISETAH